MNIAIAPVRTCNTCDVAIVGAGPYGLAAAAHLRAAGVETRIFGEPMSFWRSNMPHGMKLRSPWVATHFAHPHTGFSLDDYYREAGLELPKLLPLTNFVDYGLWFQHRIAPDLDRRKIARIDASEHGFRLALSDGDVVFARRVVMAAGLLGHEYRPPEFDNLPRALVSHSSEHTDSTRYRGKRVAVIGRGQSATEFGSAAARSRRRGRDLLARPSRMERRPANPRQLAPRRARHARRPPDPAVASRPLPL